ncbi:MAG: MYXO-CTERM sorting domain-containing protein, partial [Candidatus Thermoplasmatota archaeon]|nr:MYXO-CTERM sorting domain-containing protein [Candidatus Thermoplasmatota archaeon]
PGPGEHLLTLEVPGPGGHLLRASAAFTVEEAAQTPMPGVPGLIPLLALLGLSRLLRARREG